MSSCLIEEEGDTDCCILNIKGPFNLNCASYGTIIGVIHVASHWYKWVWIIQT